MFGKALTLVILLASQVSCAEPNYVEATPASGGQTKSTVCPANFESGLCVSYEWERMPTDGAFGSFIFKTYRVDDKSSDIVAENIPLTAAVVLWMPTMGHGSSPVTVEQIETGVYRASNIFFSMRGLWEIRFQSKDGNDIRDQVIIDFTL